MFVSGILVVNSCKKDKCKDVICENGTCVEGNCNCDYGWEGLLCDKKKSEVFLGFWEGEFDCGAFKDTTVIKIKEVENTLDSLKMNTVGFAVSYLGLSFSLDEYTFTGKIDKDFKSFKIGPNHIVFEKFGQQIEADITGKGELPEKDGTLNLAITVTNAVTSQDCQGEFKK